MRPIPNVLIAVFSIFWLISAHADNMVLVGAHPTSPSTAFPPIHTLKAFEGRIYAGHGNWNYYPAVCIASYDPVTGAWHTEHSPGSDAVGIFRPIRNSLYAPSIDPVHFEEFTDYSVLSGGIWRRHAPAGFFHVFDFATVSGNDLWMVGAKSRSETANQNAAVWRSLDDGVSWLDITLTNSQSRYYYCFALRGRLYVHDTIYDGTNATRIAAAPYPFFHKPLTVTTAAGELVLGLTQLSPGIGGFNRTSLASFDGTNWLEIKTNVVDLAVVASTVYTLDYNPVSQLNEIQFADLSAPQLAWSTLSLSNIPEGAKAIEVLDGVVYVGDINGGLWLGKADGGPITVPPAATINDLPDGFGRAMAVNETTLAVGGPEATSPAIMSGQVTVWTRSSRSAPWTQPQVLASPVPSYSGWFGKDVAAANGLLAVLEAGADGTGRDRGASAQVHLYEHDGTTWQWRQTATNTYAQSISLTSNTLWVAASTVLRRYTINRSPEGASMTLAEALGSGTSSLYEPSARVAATETRVAFGSTGDFSRNGGPGQVNVFELAASTWRQVAVLQQTSPPLPTGLAFQPDAFGFALAMAGDWLAVGAPRDDAAAWQAGAVHLYQRVVAGTNVNYVPRQKIISPVPQQDGWFGSSLAFDGDYLMIGHPGFDSPANRRREGRVYFYRLAGTNALPVGEIAAPPASQTEFGVEVALDGNVIIAGSRATAPHVEPLARIVARTVLEVAGDTADLVLAGTVEPPRATAGTSVIHTVTLSNAGPAKATAASITFSQPTNGIVSSISASAGACTTDAGVITCSLPDLESGFTVTLHVTIEPTFTGVCSIMRSLVTTSAAEFDPDLRNNDLNLAVNDFPPVVNLIQPENGTTVRFGTPVQFSAEAAASNGVTHVQFYRNDNILLGAAASTPYTYTWPQASTGTHTITARVVDQCGVISTSAPIMLVVASNALPSVSIASPLNRTRYSDTNNIQITIDASDPDGSISMVRVYSGSTLLRTFSSTPYAFTWTNAPLGTTTLRAVATDNDGGTNTSAAALIVVGNASQGSAWIAFNDHEAGIATHTYATRYHIRGDGSAASGALRNVATGATLPVSLAITRMSIDNISSPAAAPTAGTPAAQAFTGYIDYTSGVYANVPVAAGQAVTYTFTGLNSANTYNLKMTAIRGSASYTDRWSLVTLNGAQSFEAEHTSGTLTQGTGGLQPNQVAINSGFNTAGDLAHWDDIVPGPNGIIAIVTTQYTGPIPIGTGSTAPYGYAPTMVRLEQKNITLPTVSTSGVSQTVSPGATVTFTAAGSGAGPLTYQWYRDGMHIAGATSPTLTLPPVGPNDVGRYNVRISSADGHAFGQSAILSLFSIRPSLELEFVGPIGQRYQVQQRTTFGPTAWPFDPVWTTFTNITVQSIPVFFSDPAGTNAPQQFYRAVPVQ